MSVLPLVYEGDPRLRQKAIKIRSADASLRKLAEDMHETMHAERGVGLAGPQVGVMRRIAVIHIPENYDDDGAPEVNLTLINPEIIRAHGKVYAYEGCLSIPGWSAEVPRAESITVKAINLDNRPIRIKAQKSLARAIQHEIDHLDGILFLDRVEDRSTIHQIEEREPEGAVEATA
jgi:peptide deformylase